MANYILSYNDGTKDINYELSVVENVDYSAPQAIVKKETVGGDGGLIVNTGRLLKTITLNGKLLHKKVQSGGKVSITKNFNAIKDEIEEIKEQGYVVTLKIPLSTKDARKYMIEDAQFTLMSGNASYLPFTLKLIENRQVNVRTTIINLIAIGPRDQFIARLQASLQGV